MHSDHIAEWILSLVTSRERAVATVGDLAERSVGRGAVWFWTGVSRTATSLLWSGLVERPARVTGVAAACIAIGGGIELLFGGLAVAFLVAAVKTGHLLHLDSMGWKLWVIAPKFVVPLLTGRLLARWAPGREMSACLAYGIMCSILGIVMMVSFPPGNRFSVSVDVSFATVAPLALVLAGAAWGRHRRFRALQA